MKPTPAHAYFPAPLEGESVYSVCARFHRAREKMPAAATSAALQMPGAHAYPAVPVALSLIESVSGGMLPATEDTLRSRTILGAFIPLWPSSRRSAVLEACKASGTTRSAHALAGLSRYTHSSRLLKFCPECAAQDVREHGVSYWRAAAQLPGVWLCRKHGRLVEHLVITSRKKGWWLPPADSVPSGQRLMPIACMLIILRLQQVIEWIAALRALDLPSVQAMLRLRLRAAGLCRSELKWGRGELDHLTTMAHTHYSSIAVPDVEVVNADPRWFSLLFREKRHYDPLTWALALAWVGATEGRELTAEYQDAQSRKPQADLFNALLRTPRRASAPVSLYEAFSGVERKASAVRISGFTVAEVDNWLRRDPALKEHWRSSVRAAKSDASLEQIRDYVRSDPRASRHDILKVCTPAYRWLSLHEPVLLEALLPPALNHIGQRHLQF